ncbi:MAG: type II toxin-antitoxin system VapC family toxin [Desulfobacteraceae bacterium]|nr:type II toxin-antitoxin system VapC family toxin [Desulfobacteraceae bacterium]
MADYYADSSALVKRHVHETGTAWFRMLSSPASGNIIITSRISMVEVYSAFNRRLRETSLDPNDYEQLAADFTTTCLTEYELIEITPSVIWQAKLLLERYTLRAYDAVQLAAALTAGIALQRAGLLPPIFLAADERLLEAAQRENLATDNPNLHP